MFRGPDRVTLDAKGRVAVPARYREGLREHCEGKMVVTIDRDRCLLLYPLPAWQKIEQALIDLPGLNSQTRALQRLMIGHARDVELDGHGRIRLPVEHREFAGLHKQLMLIGQVNKLEVWDADRWASRTDDMLDQPGDDLTMAQALESLRL